MKALTVLLIVFALSACGEAPRILTRSVQVPTLVRGACLKAEDVPEVPVMEPITGEIDQGAAILAANALELKKYAVKADAALRGCAK